jgi:hypothetical protein
MKKVTCIKEIQKRLPDDIIVIDETPFEFTDDEYVGILSWIKLFNHHYKIHGKNEHPPLMYPIVSTRVLLNLGLYRFPSQTEDNKGKHIVYISQNKSASKRKISAKRLISTWSL